MKPESIPAEHIETRILLVRGHKVLLDADLAALYACRPRRPSRRRTPPYAFSEQGVAML
jgi:hypothetical protein